MWSDVLGLSPKDVTIVSDVVDSYGETQGYNALVMLLRKIFTTDIKTEHFILLGHLVGVRSVNDQSQFNPIPLWLEN